MDKKLENWKDPAILLTSLGIAGIGDFIYLVAINIIVYQMTGSAAAAAKWLAGGFHPGNRDFGRRYFSPNYDYSACGVYAALGFRLFILCFQTATG